ncbi:MAG: oligosaccharide flippase family protein [Aquamicrobium sp.]|uniref:Membrane protein involved in the export of O-antigen and teichoic acid n=1 Tax=Caulobacter vibrioides OR37 TaxID=1292034 RepID=R0E688_CAUVI|nr:oligosaccharide flippase family protein [Caulobacter vibrioides]ENZ81058.1 membrane protein involved in the export of O-antigen and teichoic acid [Caulobacter vibrioides OR37]MBR2690420.1 oligosaccharide flippase family protein [Aquamicrobium sp.]
MTTGGLKRNAVWNLLEVLLSSLVLFVLYRLILKHLGVASLGVWSLVLATTSLARVADLGASGGLGRYVAVSQARGQGGEEALVYVETALLTNTAFYLVLGFVLYWPAWWGLGLSIHGPALEQARSLLPFAIGSFVLQNIANVLTGALVGFHRSYQKSMLMLVTLMAQAGVAVASVKTLGLRGVALAQIVQYLLLTGAGWFLVARAAGKTGFVLPWRVRMAPLRELMGFGLRLQALNIASFLFEPFTKFAFSSLGGLSALGMYELASRGILQVRQLVVAPGQNLPPLFAAAYERDAAEMRRIYESALTVMAAASGISMLGMAVGSPLISLVWLHHVDSLFIVFSCILAAGWFFNTVSAPGYFLGIGTGRLRWNIVGGLISTLGSPALALLLAKPLAGVGVATAAMTATGCGAVFTWLMNCRSLGVPVMPSHYAWTRLLTRIAGAGTSNS